MGLGLFRKFHVLAVDDKESNLVAIEAVLNESCLLEFARSGDEALQIVKRHPHFDVILMDIQMPGLDGYETVREIKRVPGCANIPIIFVTAIYKEEPFIRKGYEVGGVDYFAKPFDPEMLKTKVAIYGSFRQKEAVLEERVRQLNESKAILQAGRTLSNSLRTQTVGVIVTGESGEIISATSSIAQILNTKIENIRHFGALLGWWGPDGEMTDDPSNPLMSALKSGRSLKNEYIWIKLADGSRKNILYSIEPMAGLDGRKCGTVIVLQDVTTSRKIELELEDRILATVKMMQ